MRSFFLPSLSLPQRVPSPVSGPSLFLCTSIQRLTISTLPKSRKKLRQEQRPSSQSISSGNVQIWIPFFKSPRQKNFLSTKMRRRHWEQNIDPKLDRRED